MIFGVGVDTVEIERVKKAVLRSPHFLTQVYTAQEIADCKQKADYFASLAARFAGKEAVSKALGISLWVEGWQQIEIRQDRGKPLVAVTGQLAETAASCGVQEIHLSMSHDKARAVAFAVAER